MTQLPFTTTKSPTSVVEHQMFKSVCSKQSGLLLSWRDMCYRKARSGRLDYRQRLELDLINTSPAEQFLVFDKSGHEVYMDALDLQKKIQGKRMRDQPLVKRPNSRIAPQRTGITLVKIRNDYEHLDLNGLLYDARDVWNYAIHPSRLGLSQREYKQALKLIKRLDAQTPDLHSGAKTQGLSETISKVFPTVMKDLNDLKTKMAAGFEIAHMKLDVRDIIANVISFISDIIAVIYLPLKQKIVFLAGKISAFALSFWATIDRNPNTFCLLKDTVKKYYKNAQDWVMSIAAWFAQLLKDPAEPQTQNRDDRNQEGPKEHITWSLMCYFSHVFFGTGEVTINKIRGKKIHETFSSMNSVFTFFNRFGEIFKYCLDWTLVKFGFDPIFDKTDAELLRRIKVSVNTMASWLEKDRQLFGTDALRAIIEDHKKLQDLYQIMVKTMNMARWNSWFTLYNRFNELACMAKNSSKSAQSRVEPYALWIGGPPGSGKSIGYPRIARDLEMLLTQKTVKESSLYLRNAYEEFWSGYHNQFTAVIDECYQTKDKKDYETLSSTILNSVSSSHYPLVMAAVEDKGNVSFNSKLLICISNFEQIPKEAGVNFPAALYRRFDFLEMKPNSELYDTETKRWKVNYDPSSAHLDYLYSVFNLDSKGTKTYKFTGVKYQDFLRYAAGELVKRQLQYSSVLDNKAQTDISNVFKPSSGERPFDYLNKDPMDYLKVVSTKHIATAFDNTFVTHFRVLNDAYELVKVLKPRMTYKDNFIPILNGNEIHSDVFKSQEYARSPSAVGVIEEIEKIVTAYDEAAMRPLSEVVSELEDEMSRTESLLNSKPKFNSVEHITGLQASIESKKEEIRRVEKKLNELSQATGKKIAEKAKSVGEDIKSRFEIFGGKIRETFKTKEVPKEYENASDHNILYNEDENAIIGKAHNLVEADPPTIPISGLDLVLDEETDEKPETQGWRDYVRNNRLTNYFFGSKDDKFLYANVDTISDPENGWVAAREAVGNEELFNVILMLLHTYPSIKPRDLFYFSDGIKIDWKAIEYKIGSFKSAKDVDRMHEYMQYLSMTSQDERGICRKSHDFVMSILHDILKDPIPLAAIIVTGLTLVASVVGIAFLLFSKNDKTQIANYQDEKNPNRRNPQEIAKLIAQPKPKTQLNDQQTLQQGVIMASQFGNILIETKGIGRSIGKTICVRGTSWIFPLHYLAKAFDKKVTSMDTNIRIMAGGLVQQPVNLAECKITLWNNKSDLKEGEEPFEADMVTLTLPPRYAIRGKDLTKYFIEDDEVDNRCLSNVVCIYPAKPGEDTNLVFEKVEAGQFLFKNEYSNYTKPFTASDDNVEYLTTHAIAYNRCGNPGDCMSLYGIDNPRSQHKFLGAHIAGSKNRSYCLLITQGHINRFVPADYSLGPILDYGGTNEEIKCASDPLTDDQKLYIPDNTNICGILDKKYNNHLNRKTDLVRTPLFPDVECARAPAILWKLNGEDPFLKALARDNFIQERPMSRDPEHFHCYLAAQELMRSRVKNLPTTFVRGRLNLLDCINHPVDAENLLGSRQSTSAGFSMRINGGGKPGKSAYIWSVTPPKSKPTYSHEPTDKLNKLWSTIVEHYKTGEILSFPYNPSLKDELRDIIKVKEMKTRVFKAGCYGLLLTTRCYNGAFLDAYRNSPELMRHCIGVNLCGGFGTYLDSVLSCGVRWAYDIKNNDNTFSRDLIWFYELIKTEFMERIDDLEEERTLIKPDRVERRTGRRTVTENALNPMSVYGRVLTRKDGTVPSGDPETSEKNSVGNKIQHDTVILSLIYDNDRKLYNQIYADYKKYDKLFPSFHLGDDMIGASPRSAAYINFDAVQERIRLFFGREITLPDKDRNAAGKIEAVTEFRRDNTEFLSRTPRDFFGNTVWCLRRSTIEAIPFWRLKGFTPDPEMCRELCDQALREWFFYGRDTFDKYKAEYDRELFRLNYGATSLTFNKMVDDWSRAVGGAQQILPWGQGELSDTVEYPGLPKTQMKDEEIFPFKGRNAEMEPNAKFSRGFLAPNPQCLRYKEDTTSVPFTVAHLVTTVSKNNQNIELAPGNEEHFEDGVITTKHQISTITESTAILDNPLEVKGFTPSVNPYPPGEVAKALCREYPIATFQFDSVDTYDGLLYQQGFPSPLLAQPYIAEKISGHKFYRATVVLRIKFNQTKFEYGSFIMNAVSKLAGNFPCADSVAMSMCEPRVVSVGSNAETIIRYPFFFGANYDLVANLADWFTLTVRCLHPLASVSGDVPNPLTVTVYAHFEDVETMGFDPQVNVAAAFASLKAAKKGGPETQSKREKSKKGKTSIDEGREKSETGLLSGIAEATSQIAPLVGMIDPEFMPVTMAVGNIASALAPFFKSLGWNKPNDVRATLFTGTNGWRGATHGMGLDSSVKLSLNPEFTIATTGGLCGDDDPNPTILSIVQRPALYLTGYFNNTSPALLIDFLVSPILPITRSFTGAPGAGYENIQLSPLSYYTSMFGFFRGSLKIMIRFNGSSLMTASVRVVLNYGTAYDVSTRKSDVINGVYDLNGDTTIKFEIPYQDAHFWNPVKDIFGSVGETCYPRLQVYSETPIKSPDYTVDPPYYYTIWMAAGDDYELYHFCGPQNYEQATSVRAPASDTPMCQANQQAIWNLPSVEIARELFSQLVRSQTIENLDEGGINKPRTQMDVQSEFKTKFDQLVTKQSFVEAGVVTGEKVDRLQTLLHRYTRYATAPPLTITPYLQFTENSVNPVLEQLCFPFAVWRGGLRFRFNGTVTMRIVAPGPARSDAYAAGCQFFGNDSLAMGVEVPWYYQYRFFTHTSPGSLGLFVGDNGTILWSAGDDFTVGYFRGTPWYNRPYTAPVSTVKKNRDRKVQNFTGLFSNDIGTNGSGG